MPDETGAKIAITGENSSAREAIELAAAPAKELGEAGEGASQAADSETGRLDRPQGEPANAAPAESQPADTPAASGSAFRAAAAAIHAAADQVSREHGDSAGDVAALAQALRTFLDTLAGQNAPTRSEFRDLAARLDRLSSQYAKGR